MCLFCSYTREGRDNYWSEGHQVASGGRHGLKWLYYGWTRFIPSTFKYSRLVSLAKRYDGGFPQVPNGRRNGKLDVTLSIFEAVDGCFSGEFIFPKFHYEKSAQSSRGLICLRLLVPKGSLVHLDIWCIISKHWLEPQKNQMSLKTRWHQQLYVFKPLKWQEDHSLWKANLFFLPFKICRSPPFSLDSLHLLTGALGLLQGQRKELNS